VRGGGAVAAIVCASPRPSEQLSGTLGAATVVVRHRPELAAVMERLLEVVAENLVELDELGTVAAKPGGKELMELCTCCLGQRVVRGVADQQVPEPVTVLADELRLLGTEEVLPDEGDERVVEAWLASTESRDSAAVEDLSLDGAPLEYVSLRRVELVEAGRQQRLDRPRDDDVAAVRLTRERQHLLDEQRIAARCAPNPRLQGLVERRAFQQARDELVGLLLGQRLQKHRRGVQLSARPVGASIQKLGARHAQEQNRRVPRQIGDVLDKLEEDRLAPLDVVEQADQRRLRRSALEELAKRPRDLVRRRGRGAVGLAEQHRERMAGRLVGELSGAACLLHDLDDGPVGDPFAVRKATAVQHGGVVESAQELRHEARLAHASGP
jgi:hypothetical protein